MFKNLRKKNPKKDSETAGQYRLRIRALMSGRAEEGQSGDRRPQRQVFLQATAPAKGGRPRPWAGAKK